MSALGGEYPAGHETCSLAAQPGLRLWEQQQEGRRGSARALGAVSLWRGGSLPRAHSRTLAARPRRGRVSESTCSPLTVMLDNRHQPGPYQSPGFIAVHSASTYQPPAAVSAVMVACKFSLVCEGETAMAQSESPVQEAGGRNKEVQLSQPPVLPFVIPLGWREDTHLDFLSQAWAGMTPYAEPVAAISEEERLMPLGRKNVLQTKPCIIFYFPLKGGER